eukprot:jgi/Hompol1/6581/HPOL_000447-RA
MVHVYSGLPWWGTILAATLLIRVALLPFAIKAQIAGVKIHNLRPVMEPIQAEMTRLKAQGDQAGAQRAGQKMFQVMNENGANPLSAAWGLAQAPVFLSLFLALKYMAELPVPGFSTGGFGWITDLSAADPYYILPIVSSAAMVAGMELASAMGGSGAQAQPESMKNIIRFIALVTVPFMAGLPVAVFVYILSSAVVTFGQMYLLNQPAVRKLFGIPERDSTLPPPINGITAVKPMSMSEAAKAVRKVQQELSKTQVVPARAISTSASPRN